MTHLLRLLFQTLCALLFVAFGVGSAFSAPGDWTPVSYPVTAQELSAQPVNLTSTARAPPTASAKVTATGTAFAQTGNLRALDGVETTGAVYAFLRSSIAPNRTLGDFFSGGTKPKASDLKSWAEAQGWSPSQTANGPLKYTDSNGVARLTIKGGSDRAPGSAKPHIEVRNESGQRIDPKTGNPVSRKSPENHTEIDFD